MLVPSIVLCWCNGCRMCPLFHRDHLLSCGHQSILPLRSKRSQRRRCPVFPHRPTRLVFLYRPCIEEGKRLLIFTEGFSLQNAVGYLGTCLLCSQCNDCVCSYMFSQCQDKCPIYGQTKVLHLAIHENMLHKSEPLLF